MKIHLNKTCKVVSLIVLVTIFAAACGGAPAAPEEASTGGAGAPSAGMIGSAERSKLEFVWISNMSTLPMFVERVHPALDKFAEEFSVTVRKAGPTAADIAAFIATVEQECARKPAGVIVVGGWDNALEEPVNKCIEAKVPVIVTDGDLPNSKRLSYVGTDWYKLGVKMAEAQIKYHKERGWESGKIASVSPFASDNMILAKTGAEDTLRGTPYELVAEEDNNFDEAQTAQRAAAILSAFPDLTGFMGYDVAGGPGIITAVEEAGKSGEIVVTVNEAGVEFLNNIKEGKADLITMENYDVMNYLALFMLYTFHNDTIRTAGLDPWTNIWMPYKVDSGLVLVTKENVDQVIEYMMEAAKKNQ